MSGTSESSKIEVEKETSPKKANQFKGIVWGIIHGLTAMIYLIIPTILIVKYWIPLNELELGGQRVYTVALLMLFLYIISLIITVIYIAAMFRAFFQRKNPDLGIPKGVQWIGVGTLTFIVVFMILWFFITGGQIFLFSMIFS